MDLFYDYLQGQACGLMSCLSDCNWDQDHLVLIQRVGPSRTLLAWCFAKFLTKIKGNSETEAVHRHGKSIGGSLSNRGKSKFIPRLPSHCWHWVLRPISQWDCPELSVNKQERHCKDFGGTAQLQYISIYSWDVHAAGKASIPCLILTAHWIECIPEISKKTRLGINGESLGVRRADLISWNAFVNLMNI